MEVFNIVYYGQDKLKPKDQVGTIKVVNEYEQEYCLYKFVEEHDENLPSIGNNEQLVITGPTDASIPSDVAFSLNVNLSDGVYKASISCNALDDSCDSDYREISIESEDGSGELSILYAQFASAVEARVKLELCPPTNSSVSSHGNVYGLVAARTSAFQHPMFTSVLFSTRQSHKRTVLTHGEIPLSRSVVAVPTDSKLCLCINMYINDVNVSAVVDLHPKSSGRCDSQYLPLGGGEEEGGIKVTVTWMGGYVSSY